MQLNELYGECCTHHADSQWKLAAKEDRLSKQIEQMVERLWASKTLPLLGIDKAVVTEFAKKLWDGVEKGYGKKLNKVDYTTPDGNMLAALQDNVWQFAAAKNRAQLIALSKALVDDTGKLRTYNDFKREAFKINDQHVNQWLQTEYELAVAGGQMSAKWVNIEAQADTLPLLEFDAVIDQRTSDLCRTLHKTILPLNHPFWDTYYPPNHFKCRSTVWQRRSGKITPENKIQYAEIPAMFKVNLAKERLVFPPKHPYFDGLSNEIKNGIRDILPKQPVTSLADLNRYFDNYAKENPDDFIRGFKQLAVESKVGNNGSTDCFGTIYLKKDRVENIIKSLNSVDSTFDQEDSLSTLWHEINHNKNKYGIVLMNKTQVCYMECANEFVSRKTLPDFINKLGKNFSNPILTEDRASTGYNTMVKNIDYLFKKTGLEKEGLELMKKLAYDTRYNEIHKEMISNVSEMIKSLNKKVKLTDAKRIVRLCVEAGQARISTVEQVDRFLLENF